MANSELLHNYRTPPQPMQVLEFPLALALARNGTLRLRCNQRPGSGGDGRACCVSEVWLRKTTDKFATMARTYIAARPQRSFNTVGADVGGTEGTT